MLSMGKKNPLGFSAGDQRRPVLERRDYTFKEEEENVNTLSDRGFVTKFHCLVTFLAQRYVIVLLDNGRISAQGRKGIVAGDV